MDSRLCFHACKPHKNLLSLDNKAVIKVIKLPLTTALVITKIIFYVSVMVNTSVCRSSLININFSMLK